jgi:hypothetical protein
VKKILGRNALLFNAFGLIFLLSGIIGVVVTHKTVAREKIITPADASIPETPVRGPLTLKVQGDIIREHVLKTTGGKTYAEMSREDSNRDIWITATTLTTALGLGILAYAFSVFVASLGVLFICFGLIFRNESLVQ